MNTPTQVTNGLGKGNWTAQKAQLKTTFPTLTDADLTFENGKMDEMITNLEKKLGKTKDEISKLIEPKL